MTLITDGEHIVLTHDGVTVRVHIDEWDRAVGGTPVYRARNAATFRRSREAREARNVADRAAHPDGWMHDGWWAWCEVDKASIGQHRTAPASYLWRVPGGRTIHTGTCGKLGGHALPIRVDPSETKWKRCGCCS